MYRKTSTSVALISLEVLNLSCAAHGEEEVHRIQRQDSSGFSAGDGPGTARRWDSLIPILLV